MIRHMISSHSMAGSVLPYGRLFTYLFSFHGLDLIDQIDRQEPRHYDTFTASTLRRMGILAIAAQPVVTQEEDEFRGIEIGADPIAQMEDDLHIPPLQTEYPSSYGVPPFDTDYQFEPP